MRSGSSAGSWVSGIAVLAMLALPGLAVAAEPAASSPQAPAAQPAPAPAPTAPAAATPTPTQAPAPSTTPPTTLAPSDIAPGTTASPPLAPARPPAASQTTKTVYGAWTVVCGSPDASSDKRCVLMQSVVSQERPEMQISVAISKTPGSKNALLRVQAPLSILLPNGLGLYVDGNDIGSAYFARCFADGCYAEVALEDKLLDQLRKGGTATFTIFQTQEEGIGIPVDLKGFADGYDALP